MRECVLENSRRNLARGAALLMIAGLSAGCSSSAARFGGGTDGILTASTANQRSIIRESDQPFPGDRLAPRVDTTYSGSAARSAVEPVNVSSRMDQGSGVERRALTPVASAPQVPTPAPVMARPEPVREPAPRMASAPAVVDRATTGTVATLPAAPTRADTGWVGEGGTQVTVKQGETVYNLSRRFGVPVDAIVKANGLSGPDALSAGQKIVIPAYAYSSSAPISAPDANPNVADAKSSRGTRYDVPSEKVPLPSRAPESNVAVLPQPPKPREDTTVAQVPSLSPENADGKPAASNKPSSAAGTYTVASGDSLYLVARKNGTTVEAIKAANNLSTPTLKIGQKLVIPAAGANIDPVKTAAVEPKPQKAAPEAPAAYTPPKKAEKAISEVETETAAVAPGASGIGKMRWPVRGRVVSGFGQGGGTASRDGIDISVPEGTSVKAAENGVVIYAGNGLKEFGNTVLVRHDNGLVTVYGHASEINVARGEKVKRGQEIAKSGMSGSTDTPKLHFEVRKDSAPVDPSKFLE